VTNSLSNLRSGPGASFAVVQQLQAGTCVRIVARNTTGDWYKLDNDSWIAAFLIDNQPAGGALAVDESPTPVLAQAPTFTPSWTPAPTESSIGTPTPAQGGEPAPEAVPTVTDAGPPDLSALLYDAELIYYDSCGAYSRTIQFWVEAYDPDGIAEVTLNYYYERSGLAVSEVLASKFDFSGDPNFFVVNIDIGQRAYDALYPDPGHIVFWISVADLLGNTYSTAPGNDKPVSVGVAPC
jgi:hypothetical protein